MLCNNTVHDKPFLRKTHVPYKLRVEQTMNQFRSKQKGKILIDQHAIYVREFKSETLIQLPLENSPWLSIVQRAYSCVRIPSRYPADVNIMIQS